MYIFSPDEGDIIGNGFKDFIYNGLKPEERLSFFLTQENVWMTTKIIYDDIETCLGITYTYSDHVNWNHLKVLMQSVYPEYVEVGARITKTLCEIMGIKERVEFGVWAEIDL